MNIWWNCLLIFHCFSKNVNPPQQKGGPADKEYDIQLPPREGFTIWHHKQGHTVIRFVWVSAKFGTCTVVSVNRTLIEDKMRSFKGECAYFSFSKCPICNHDSTRVKFSTNSHKTDNRAVQLQTHSALKLWSIFFTTVYTLLSGRGKATWRTLLLYCTRKICLNQWNTHDCIIDQWEHC